MNRLFTFILSISLSWSLFAEQDRLVFDSKGQSRGHIVLVSGDEEYRSEEALPQFAKILSQQHNFKCTVLFSIDPERNIINPRVRDNLPGLDTLKDADLMILFTRWRLLPDHQMKHIDTYLQSGKPVMALRTATHAFAIPDAVRSVLSKHNRQNRKLLAKNPKAELPPQPTFSEKEWNDGSSYGHYGDGYLGSNKLWYGGFGKVVVGDGWVSHHGKHKHESTKGILNESMKTHPILKGVGDGIWSCSDVYEVHPPKGYKALVYGQVVKRAGEFDKEDLYFGMRPSDSDPVVEKNQPMMPIVWTRSFTPESGKTLKVLSTTMGASVDFLSDDFRKLLVNGVYWCVGQAKNIPNSGCRADLVGDFKPTQFGFHSDDHWSDLKLTPSQLK